MAIKKSELYSSLWKSCDELRGGMDASQYKDYILTLLFVKYVSDKYGDNEGAVLVPEGGSFADMVRAKNKPDIGDQMNKIITKLFEENDLKGEIDVPDYNDDEKLGKGKEMVDRLTKLIGVFQNPALNFSKNRADGDDLLGDAYEYLMRHFATESGKSKGQFYTPAEVSRILASVIDIHKAEGAGDTVYDPTCGSGSLLLKVADAAGKELSLYGQENDNATKSLAVMNMWMHNVPTAEIWKGNTLADPHWSEDGQLKRFDYVVANPPFSYKSWTTGFEADNDPWKRFDGYDIPPDKNGDYAFLLHILKSMKSTGKGAVILPHGVLFRGNAEGKIRKELIKRGYIKGIIGLPANLFYGTGIPACVIVLDKEEAQTGRGIFMLDASKGFIKDGNKNRLREQDLHKIIDVFNKELEVPKYSRKVELAEIMANEYNLNIPRYIDSQEEEDIQDLGAHLQGGIPQRDIAGLAKYWEVYPGIEASLFEDLRAGYSQLKVDKSAIKNSIFGHAEFIAYGKELDAVFTSWKEAHYAQLKGISSDSRPKDFIQQISEGLLHAYEGKALIDPYDIFQHLMDYWEETMKDDVYLLVEDGWVANLEPVKDKKGKEKKGEYSCELIPKELIIHRYFSAEQAALDQQAQEVESLAQQMEELKEEHSGEEGLLAESTNDKGKISKATLSKRLKEIKKDPNAAEEKVVIEAYLSLIEQEAKGKKAVQEAEKELSQMVIATYPQLSIEEIKNLVVDDKWLASLAASIKAEVDAISQRLTSRIKELADRYEYTLGELDKEVEEVGAKVELHLQKMGLEWK